MGAKVSSTGRNCSQLLGARRVRETGERR